MTNPPASNPPTSANPTATNPAATNPTAAADWATDPGIVDVELREEGIRLGQFLKLANLADSGSHAKELLEADAVSVNNEPEARRGRQLSKGDIITVGVQKARLV